MTGEELSVLCASVGLQEAPPPQESSEPGRREQRAKRAPAVRVATTRAAAVLEKIVPVDFGGIIQCDGYSAYDAFIKTPTRAGRIELAGCMAHARRKFFEARDEGEDPQWVLAQVQQLYRIEARLREARAGPEEVLTTRQQHSAPIMAAIKARLEQLQASHKHRPTSLTGEALSLSLIHISEPTRPY